MLRFSSKRIKLCEVIKGVLTDEARVYAVPVEVLKKRQKLFGGSLELGVLFLVLSDIFIIFKKKVDISIFPCYNNAYSVNNTESCPRYDSSVITKNEVSYESHD